MKKLLMVLFLAVASSTAFAWPACGGNWVSVPKSTSGGTLYSTGDLLFQCQLPTPKTPSSPSFSSAASSSSSATNNSSQKQGQTQGQTATGGNASATGGQASATASNSASSTGGNNANNSTSNTFVQRNTPMAYAPEAIPSAPCVKGYSAGASGPAFGASLGAGKTDKECEIRETARAFALGGSRIAYCKVLITSKDAKNAGVTLEDCLMMYAPPSQVVVTPEPTPVPVPTIVIVPGGLTLQNPPVILPVLPLQPRKRMVARRAVKKPILCASVQEK